MKKKLMTLFVLLSLLMVGCSSNKEKEGTIEGVVVDATMNTVLIEREGKEYSFMTEDAEVVAGERGLLIGDTVKVYYTGELNEEETAQTVKVTKLEVTKEGEVVESSKIEGIVVDATMNTIVIETAEGKQYYFATEGASIDAGTNGIIIGDTVEITFKGQLDDSQESQTVEVESIKVIKMAEDQYIDGEVVEVTEEMVKIKIENGTQLSFFLEGAEMFIGDAGLVEGDLVRIYYEGMLNERIEMQSVQVKSIQIAVVPLAE